MYLRLGSCSLSELLSPVLEVDLLRDRFRRFFVFFFLSLFFFPSLSSRSGKAGTVDRIDHLTAVGQKGATLAIAISAALWAHANIAYLAVSAFATLVFIEIGARGEVAKTFLGEIATNSLTESLSPGF